MTDAPDPQLEKQLGELTTWQGPKPDLWRRALAGARSPVDKARLARIFRRRVPGWAVGGIAAAMIFVAVGFWMSQTMHLGLEQARAPATGAPTEAQPYRRGVSRVDFGGYPDASYGYQLPFVAGGQSARSGRGTDLRVPLSADRGPYFTGMGESSDDTSQPPGERHVVRKATIELGAKDVRAAFLKASLLISEAQGEFVQDSSLTGSGDKMQANLTLRVAADRLPGVLNELRQLGEVRAEATGGEDVTAQVVDLEARLRNEQRVETELLQLLERRQDAPLKEILELRTTIGQVRQTIEQLTAQRQRLSRLVSLATVLVIIRPADAPPRETQSGLGAYFTESLADAWHKGVLFLVNTLAGILSILIGGLIWWVLLIAALLTLRAYRRRRGAQST